MRKMLPTQIQAFAEHTSKYTVMYLPRGFSDDKSFDGVECFALLSQGEAKLTILCFRCHSESLLTKSDFAPK